MGDRDVHISISRLPYHIDLLKRKTSTLQLEMSIAYQKTEQSIRTFALPGESIDSDWAIYGAGLRLSYMQQLTGHLYLTPSLRAGVTRMSNHASYNGVLTNQIKDLFEGTILNRSTNASVVNTGLGLSYDWAMHQRASHVTADVYHVFVDAFNESNAAVKFNEQANMLAVGADMLFPTDMTIAEKRLDIVLLLGENTFFGENRRRLGYTTSYQFGIGSELPFTPDNTLNAHIRLSAHALWADHMKGWLLTLGYNPE